MKLIILIQKLWLVIFLLFLFSGIHGQNSHFIHVDPAQPSYSADSELRPGLFYFQHWQQTQNAVFNYISRPNMYNALRQQKFNSECWKWSSSFQDVMDKMESVNLKDWLIHLEQYTDHVVVKINAMPYWISSSSDWNTLPGDDSWRVFMTHPPSDYQLWDSLIREVVGKINSWGIHPYYEIWNEPDGQYWNAPDGELLKLYRHTAKAITQADPQAKVGGFGMHTWWKSVDPLLYQQQEPYKHPMWGYVDDDIANQYSVLYDLLDSIANNWREYHVPLDFISWHFFNWNTNTIPHTSAQLRSKMEELGYVHPSQKRRDELAFPDLFISEWQTTYGIQEKLFQPPLFLRIMKKMDEGDVNFHSIAAIGDFGSDPNQEFREGWGMFTENGIIKPVFKALLLLSDVINNGEMIPVESSSGMDVFASVSQDTLRILASNYTMPIWWYSSYWKFAWSAYERLLYDSASFYTKPHFIDKGYTSVYWGNSPGGQYGNVDEIMRGNAGILPGTPAEMELALVNAQQQYTQDSLGNIFPHQLEVLIKNQHGFLEGRIVRMDSTRNNVVYIYDSLVNIAGYSNARAVDSLQSCTFTGGCFGIYHEYENVVLSEGLLNLELDPNSVVYLEIPGVDLTTEIITANYNSDTDILIYPNPINDNTVLTLNGVDQGEIVIEIFSLMGGKINTLVYPSIAGENKLQVGKAFQFYNPGTYLLKVHNGNEILYVKAIVL